jgi:hypothetical protein
MMGGKDHEHVKTNNPELGKIAIENKTQYSLFTTLMILTSRLKYISSPDMSPCQSSLE